MSDGKMVNDIGQGRRMIVIPFEKVFVSQRRKKLKELLQKVRIGGQGKSFLCIAINCCCCIALKSVQQQLIP